MLVQSSQYSQNWYTLRLKSHKSITGKHHSSLHKSRWMQTIENTSVFSSIQCLYVHWAQHVSIPISTLLVWPNQRVSSQIWVNIFTALCWSKTFLKFWWFIQEDIFRISSDVLEITCRHDLMISFWTPSLGPVGPVRVPVSAIVCNCTFVNIAFLKRAPQNTLETLLPR